MDSWRGARPNACRRRTRDSDRLLADRCLDPPTPSASPARLLSQPTVLIHLAAALAVWALGLPAQHRRARGGLEAEFADVCVDNREALLCEHRAIGQTQPVHLAFLGSGPRPEIPNCGWQRLESVPALGAKEMQPFVFVGAPDLITHLGLRTPQGSHNGRMADVIVVRDLAQALASSRTIRAASRAWCA